VVNKLWARFGAYGVAALDGIISPAYWVLRLDDSAVEPRFLHHLLRSPYYRAEVWRRSKDMPPNGFDLPWQEFRQIRVQLPSIREQRAIADYLDRETARIDALVAAKRWMLKLLVQQRDSRISHLLWGSAQEMVRLKFVTELPTSGNRDHSSFTPTDEGVPCLRGLNVRPGSIDRANLLYLSQEDHVSHHATRLRAGDVVVVRSGLAGAAAMVPTDLDDCNCVDLVIIRRSEKVVPKYLEYVINSREAREQVIQRSVGALLTHFNAADAADLILPMRGLKSQREIVGELETFDEHYRRTAGLLDRQIGLLTERRGALIAASTLGELYPRRFGAPVAA
jgi:type I restriction enzyme S subunit